MTTLKEVVALIKPVFNLKCLVHLLTQIVCPRFWRDWWYWNKVEDRLLAYVKKTATEGDPASVLAAVERYNQEYEWTYILDPDKVVKLQEVMKSSSPEVCFEMGCFIGCSAIAIGRQLPAGGRLITVEMDSEFADIARQIVHMAGLDQVITVVTGKAEDVMRVLRSEYSVDKLDLVFIDHEKTQYFTDLKKLEATSLIRKGTVIMADNTLWPGAPDYLEYVESSGRYKTERFNYMIPFFNEPDVMTISVCTSDE